MSCSKETVDPNTTGNIEGQVRNSSSGEPLPSVSITTNPGTDAILTNEQGDFTINDIPTGNYSIQAVKEDYESKTVRVAVKEDRTATAQILLVSNDQSIGNTISASVTEFFNTERNDSSFVETDYIVKNNEGSTVINYEVYFQIYTSTSTFYYEVMGDSLDNGEQSIGSFSKYIRDQVADSVVISGIYTPDS